jgi:hypothetical protein
VELGSIGEQEGSEALVPSLIQGLNDEGGKVIGAEEEAFLFEEEG